MEEAFRSNAAVVGPKLVDWDDPQRLLQVGQGMDHAGYGVPLVERGELDQSQHDAVRDVFTVPGPCTLVRADLFAEIGGFDEGISDFLDDVSLCWRAQIAGARVIVAPDARVRNRDELATRVGYDQRRRLQARHRLRIVLSCYGPLGVARVVVQTIVLNVAEILYALIAGRTKRVGDVVLAWTWNLGRLGELRGARKQVREFRHVSRRRRAPEHAPRAARGSASCCAGRSAGARTASPAWRAAGGRRPAGCRPATCRVAATVWAAVLLVLVAGSRHLLTRGVPEVGQMVELRGLPDRPAPGLGERLAHGGPRLVLAEPHRARADRRARHPRDRCDGAAPHPAHPRDAPARRLVRLPARSARPARAGRSSRACSSTWRSRCPTTRSPTAGGMPSCSTPPRRCSSGCWPVRAGWHRSGPTGARRDPACATPRGDCGCWPSGSPPRRPPPWPPWRSSSSSSWVSVSPSVA